MSHCDHIANRMALTVVEIGTQLVDGPDGERFVEPVRQALDGAELDPALEGTEFELFWTCFQRAIATAPAETEAMTRFKARLAEGAPRVH